VTLFVPLEHGVQAELRFHLGNRIFTNRLWFVVVAGDPTTADLLAIANGVKSWSVGSLLPLLSRDVHFLSVRTYDATIAYPSAFQVASVGLDGGYADDSLSANVAVKASFKTEVPPGVFSNWNFVGGIPKSAVNLNTIDTTYRSNIEFAYVDLLDVFSLFVYRWEATTAVVSGVPLSMRDHHRIDHIKVRSPYVSQRRTRLDNPP
jgi:hypothetical protein